LSVAHVDCDALFATVEKRGRPELTDSHAADPPTLFDGSHRLEHAIDQIRTKLGQDTLQFGRGLPHGV